MIKFKVGDTIVHIATNQLYFVDQYNLTISSFPKVECFSLTHTITGHKRVVHDSEFKDYDLHVLSIPPSFPIPGVYTTPPGIGHIQVSMVGGGGGGGGSGKSSQGIDFVPIQINIGDTTPYCDHDYLTWTGLHGTITDCTKCKKVKNDN